MLSTKIILQFLLSVTSFIYHKNGCCEKNTFDNAIKSTQSTYFLTKLLRITDVSHTKKVFSIALNMTERNFRGGRHYRSALYFFS